MLETLDYTIRIGSTPTFLYFDLLLPSYLSWYMYFPHFAFNVALYDTGGVPYDILQPVLAK